MKKIFVLSFLSIQIISFAQVLQSPADFLGYALGTKYTRHHRIVEYFNNLAIASKDKVVLQQYGTTNEGRPLLFAVISSPENIANLENIRKNNLRIAGLNKDKIVAEFKNSPAIVWLSYNVHGNETSSSEAAMQTIYELVNPANIKTKEWLKNIVVIIDPCLNPDGRDRYVNWYNQVANKVYNVDPQSREHSEPWPGGRSNHYNFDLNRDWAWQTQIETQQRLKKYNEWMPQVHVDFHEQGINEPYYFAPAAEPFHESISNWQRDFQTQIGKNNSAYFDAKGWLYFTKERFDLLYPSYGDTYPIFNGSIGMTYEQGGHSRGGLGVIKSDGDTLTLVDRVQHHFTTGLSTIEIASNQSQRLVAEFKKFFEDGMNAKDALYKTYILSSNDALKLDAVKHLLTNNQIDFTDIENSTFKGYNYQTQKEEDIILTGNSIAVSALQPKSILLKVLLEPKTKLADSATYDITAWSLPYAFGVDGFAIKDKKIFEQKKITTAIEKTFNSNYGYIIPYNSFASAKAMAYLIQKNIKVRFTEKPFAYKSKIYNRGTLLVIKTSNNLSALNTAMKEVEEKFHIQSEIVETGFMDKGPDFGSPDVKMIQMPKVVLLTGEQVNSAAAGEIWNLFEQQLGYPITLINTQEIGRYDLSQYTSIIMPDGTYKSLSDKITIEKLRDFVKNGGKIVAIENAVQQLMSIDFGLKMKEDKKEDTAEYGLLKKYAERERDEATRSIPGAIYKVDLDNTHPLAFGYGNQYYTLKQDANIYEFIKEGWNVGVLKKENYVTGFSGFNVKNKLKDGTVLGTIEVGRGSIVFFAENPIFRLFWENGKLLLANAIFLVGN